MTMTPERFQFSHHEGKKKQTYGECSSARWLLPSIFVCQPEHVKCPFLVTQGEGTELEEVLHLEALAVETSTSACRALEDETDRSSHGCGGHYRAAL